MRALRGLRFRLPLILLLSGAAYVVIDSWIEQSVRQEAVRRSVLAHVANTAGRGAADLAAAANPSPAWIRKFLRARAAELPQPLLVALVDAGGRILEAAPPVAAGSTLSALLGASSDQGGGDGAPGAARARLLAERRAVGESRVPSGPLAGRRLVVAIDARERFAAVAGGVGARSLPGAALGIAIVALLAWLLERWLHEPSRRLQEAAERIAAGDRTARANLSGDDELSRAGAAFDRMADVVARTELELVAAQRRLDAVLQALPIGVSVFARDDGRLLFLNPRLLDLLGIAPEPSGTYLDLLRRLRVRRLDGTPLLPHESATARAIVTGRAATATDLVLTRPDGEDVPHATHAVPISLLSEGEADAIVTVLQDQRETLRLSEEVHLWKRRYERVVEATGQVVYDWDLVTGQVHRSSNYATTLGYALDANDALGAWRSRLHPNERIRVAAELEACLRSGTPFRAEYRLQHGLGHWITIREQGFIDLDPDGRPVRMYGTMADVTAQREVESQLVQAQKMESIGTMAGGIAHDFNNQLTGLIGHLDLLQDTVPGGERSLEHVRVARAAAERCADLTRGLLAFSRRIETHPQLASLNTLVEETARLLRHALPVTVRIETELAPGLPAALIDAGQIQQALMNLCLNASDAMPAGGSVLVATRKATAPDGTSGHFVELSVADTGSGIAPEVLPRIFEPFFTTKPLGKGTGLGLSMAYGTVTKHGGRIEVENRPGKGACFRILLPAAEGPAPMPPREFVPGLPRPGQGELVLVVDDESVVRSLAVKTLEGAGYRVVSAGNADEALAQLLAHAGAVRAALLDVMMPGRTGLEVLPELRGIDPQLSVVITSGNTSEFAPSEAPRTAFLSKPFSPRALIEAVRRALEAARAPHA